MRIPWSLIGIAAVLLPLGAYVAGTMAGSSEAPEQRTPIVVSGTLTPDPSGDVDPSATPPGAPNQQGDDPGQQTKPKPKDRTEPAKPKKPQVVRPNIDDDDDDDEDDDDGDDDGDDDEDDD